MDELAFHEPAYGFGGVVEIVMEPEGPGARSRVEACETAWGWFQNGSPAARSPRMVSPCEPIITGRRRPGRLAAVEPPVLLQFPGDEAENAGNAIDEHAHRHHGNVRHLRESEAPSAR